MAAAILIRIQQRPGSQVGRCVRGVVEPPDALRVLEAEEAANDLRMATPTVIRNGLWDGSHDVFVFTFSRLEYWVTFRDSPESGVGNYLSCVSPV